MMPSHSVSAANGAADPDPFPWTRFYEEVADRLLEYRNRRGELAAGIHGLYPAMDGGRSIPKPKILNDQLIDGSRPPIEDLDLFTVFLLFNRTDKQRQAERGAVARAVAGLLGAAPERIPKSFAGIPTPRQPGFGFFRYTHQVGQAGRQPEDIGDRWALFERAVALAASDSERTRQDFCDAYDRILEAGPTGASRQGSSGPAPLRS